MSMFWMLAAGLLMLVGWLVLPTLLGRTAHDGVDRAALNRTLQRKEMAELEIARANGELDDTTYAQARSDLERRILDAAQTAVELPRLKQPQLGRVTALMLVIVVPVIAVLAYLVLGAGAPAITQPQAVNPMAEAGMPVSPHTGASGMSTAEVPPIDQLTERLAQRLRQNPDDADSWLLLARSYHYLGRQAAAQEAYAQAQAHGGDDAELAALIAAPAADTAALPTITSVDPLDDLKARADANPNDGTAWLDLAQAYRSARDFQAASEAYAKARTLLPANADLLADYADALAAAHDRRLDGEPATLVDQALQLDPDHPKALWLAATAALQRNDKTQAKAYWEHLQQLLPEDSADRRVIDRNLAALDGESMGMQATEPPVTSAAVVRGRVDITPELRARVADDDTVFIFARAADGPPMPLAVLRKQVRDLPFEFSLDDSLAMRPQLKLSGFDQVMLGARVSHSGTVTQQPGEPRGDLGPVPTRGGGELRLLIDKTGS